MAAALIAPAAAGAQAPVKAELRAAQSGGKVTFDASRSTGAAGLPVGLERRRDVRGRRRRDAHHQRRLPAWRHGDRHRQGHGRRRRERRGDDAPHRRPGAEAAGPDRRRTEPAAAKPAKAKVIAAAAGGVTIKDFSFGPKTVTVQCGDSVTWDQPGPTGHSTTAKNGSWDSGVLSAGKSFLPHFRSGRHVHVLLQAAPVHDRDDRREGGLEQLRAAAVRTAADRAQAPAGTGDHGDARRGRRSNSLPNTGGDPFPWVALGMSLLAFGAALRWRLRAE